MFRCLNLSAGIYWDVFSIVSSDRKLCLHSVTMKNIEPYYFYTSMAVTCFHLFLAFIASTKNICTQFS